MICLSCVRCNVVVREDDNQLKEHSFIGKLGEPWCMECLVVAYENSQTESAMLDKERTFYQKVAWQATDELVTSHHGVIRNATDRHKVTTQEKARELWKFLKEDRNK